MSLPSIKALCLRGSHLWAVGTACLLHQPLRDGARECDWLGWDAWVRTPETALLEPMNRKRYSGS